MLYSSENFHPNLSNADHDTIPSATSLWYEILFWVFSFKFWKFYTWSAKTGFWSIFEITKFLSTFVMTSIYLNSSKDVTQDLGPYLAKYAYLKLSILWKWMKDVT